ncbi:MAG: hypothetical protein RIQ68_846 [Pseudomonadota bacterium]
MERVAVFVDAGYLFAQGSVAIAGEKLSRTSLSLDPRRVRDVLVNFARSKATGCSLLRIYWYDGALPGVYLTSDQARLGEVDDVKLRLGVLSKSGQHRGVDSLLVTDLLELARQRAISDAILITADEGLRLAVQIAQNLGVRVHLLGIEPSRANQGAALRLEVDTVSEWNRDVIAGFLAVRQSGEARAEGAVAGAQLEDVPQVMADGLLVSELQPILDYVEKTRSIPFEIDRQLLAASRNALGRNLNEEEKQYVRAEFRACVQDRVDELLAERLAERVKA